MRVSTMSCHYMKLKRNASVSMHSRLRPLGCISGMLTRPEVDEAEANIALIFFSQILHFDPIFSKKNEIFGSIFDGTSKILAQNGL